MRQAVVIGSWYGGREPLTALLDSLKGCKYPVWVVVNGAANADPVWLDELGSHYNLLTINEDRYELGAIGAVLGETDLDEFVFLQDSMVVLDQSFLDSVFAYSGSVALSVAGFHYHMKFRRAVLEQIVIPVVTTKAESVHHEGEFTRDYMVHEPLGIWTFDEHFHDGEPARMEERYGRLNMVLANRFYEKYKADWGQRPLL